jgi:CHAT domain-containing protein
MEWSATDAALVEALSRAAAKRDVAVEADLRARLERIGRRRAELEAELAKRYPAYAELANPQPLESERVQRLLGPGEALVAYILGPARSYAWVVRNERTAMRVLDVSVAELADAVTVLRRGLDPRSQASRGARKPEREGMVVGGFDLERAHDLYRKIWQPIEPLLEGVDQVLLVPDGPLAALPFSLLVRTTPAEQQGGLEGLRRVDWLVKRYATTTLPAVSSLRALRELAATGPAGRGFAGFGDPLLEGDRRPELALARQDVRGLVSNMESLRQLAPRPDSAGELKALAASLKDRETLVLLGPEATERRIRAMDLSRFGILAFATHGLMAGELDGLSEPGLVLTPPAKATAEDDGVLSAGEIAGLRLNAEWIILSACNTAAPDGSPGGEGLSGLARAFFYGGARSLLVSHWSVYSRAAVDITTGILDEMERRPGIGRARALRRVMLQLIEQGANPHPSYWAPFVVVGEGGVRPANR